MAYQVTDALSAINTSMVTTFGEYLDLVNNVIADLGGDKTAIIYSCGVGEQSFGSYEFDAKDIAQTIANNSGGSLYTIADTDVGTLLAHDDFLNGLSDAIASDPRYSGLPIVDPPPIKESKKNCESAWTPL